MEQRFKNDEFRLAVFSPPESYGGTPEAFCSLSADAARREAPDFAVFFSCGGDARSAADFALAMKDLCPGAAYPGDGSEPVLFGGEPGERDFAVRIMGKDGLLRWALYLFGPVPEKGAYLRTELYKRERRRLDAFYYECGSLLFTYEPVPELAALAGSGDAPAHGLLCAMIEDKRALAVVSGPSDEAAAALRHMERDIFIGSVRGSIGRVFSLNSVGKHGYETREIRVSNE